MGNIFRRLKKKNDLEQFNISLLEPLNNNNNNNNYDKDKIINEIISIKNNISLLDQKIIVLENNTQENINLISQDIHHINNLINK